ncbi:type 1 fimbria pilin [Silvimonas terrae]|uniref:Type 1 fimbria pilin n=1 Tax=Silvimonas terrae TaxID=300266 RepID=A0A840RHS9_9NEIS|nr:fimbrial protein [Silvimonas terrae]MBB5191822.1 type 1 fimbria pilin [Silvimonas terrae]
MKKHSFFLFALLMIDWSGAQAASTCNSLGGNIAPNFGTVTGPAHLAPGSDIASVSNDVIIQCKDTAGGTISFTNTITLISTSSTSGEDTSFNTGSSAIGLRIYITYPQCNVFNQVIHQNIPLTMVCPRTNVGNTYQQELMTVTTKLSNRSYRLPAGTLGSGGPQLKMSYTESDSGGPWAQVNPLSGPYSGAIVGSTCSIPSKNLTVNLDPVNSGDLSIVGATSAPKIFNISLDCPDETLKVGITLTDSTQNSNRTSVLTNASGSTATGLSFQFVDESGNPVLMGPDSPNYNTENQRIVGTSTGGTFNIPLGIRYIRTGNITPGTLMGLATYTFSYQ